MNNLKSKLLGGGAGAHKDAPLSWRVNFVNKEALPDIKAIRTEFLVNYGCVALALAALGFAVSQEMSIRDANAELAKTNTAIGALLPADEKIREKSALCGEYLGALDGFAKYKQTTLDFFGVYGALGAIKVPGMVYENVLVDTSVVDLKTKKVRAKIVVSGKKKGISGQTFEAIAAVYEQFGSLPYFKGLKGYEAKKTKSPVTSPDSAEQVVNFTFELTLEPL